MNAEVVSDFDTLIILFFVLMMYFPIKFIRMYLIKRYSEKIFDVLGTLMKLEKNEKESRREISSMNASFKGHTFLLSYFFEHGFGVLTITYKFPPDQYKKMKFLREIIKIRPGVYFDGKKLSSYTRMNGFLAPFRIKKPFFEELMMNFVFAIEDVQKERF